MKAKSEIGSLLHSFCYVKN